MYRNVTYSNNKGTISEWTWNADGKPIKRVVPFKPYLYVETNSDSYDAISIFETKLKKMEFASDKTRRLFSENTDKRLFYNLSVKQQYLLENYQHMSMDEMTQHPLRTFYLDIEVYSHDSFPEADVADYPINLITFYDTGTEKFYTWGLANDYDTSDVEKIGIDPNIVVYTSCSSEENLIESFIEFWSKNHPDLVTTWNGSTFDIPYIVNRTRRLCGEEVLRKLSPNNFIYSRTRSNLFGRMYTHWVIDAVSDVDYLELYAKSEMNQHESYKLDYIGNYEGVDGKVSYESANLAVLADEDWKTFVTYNIQDVNILVKLEKKKNYLKIARGKSYRGFSTLDKALDSVPIVTGMIAKAGLDVNKIIVTFKPQFEDHAYEGGYVFKPSGKVHKGIVSFDVNSLYPNTMITLNTSPETKLGKVIKNGDNYIIQLVNGKSKTVSPEVLDEFLIKNNIIRTKSNILFSQKKMGICPMFLDNMYKERKEIQAKMAIETNPEVKSRMNIEQYLLKILLNSVYGVFGNKYFGMYDIDIATSVTLTGQSMIKKSTDIVQDYAREHYGVSDDIIVYGDSVTSDTPILLRDSTGNVVIKQIDDISTNWKDYFNFKPTDKDRFSKEQSALDVDYEVWTSKGWSKINKIIRHKVEKDIYRVKTHVGFVDVTEDHSLLDSSGNQLKPRDCVVGQELLHNYIDFEPHNTKSHSQIYDLARNIHYKSTDEKIAFIYGYFYGDGSCGDYDCKSGRKRSWALNSSNVEYCSNLKSILEEVYGCNFAILDTLKSSGVYKIVPVGDVKGFVEKYRNMFYNKDKFKIVPEEILNASVESKEAFLAGYFLADGYKCDNTPCKNLTFNNKGKIGLSGLMYIGRSLGYSISVRDRKDKFNNYTFNLTNGKLRKPPHEVKDIYKLNRSTLNEYVYDIETETGDFNTGSPLIVKNTDSNFFDFDKIMSAVGVEFFDSTDEQVVVTEDAAKIIQEFEDNLNTEINEWAKRELNTNNPKYKFSREKICSVGMFITKKNYILRVLDNEGTPCDKIVEKGVELVKSSHSDAVKKIIRDVVYCIFYDKGKTVANKNYIDGLDEFKKLPPEDIAWRKNAKDHEKWYNMARGFVCGKGTPIHHRGAIYYNQLLKELNLEGEYPKITTGQKIKYTYLEKNKYGMSVISFPDKLPPEFELKPDYDFQYKKMITPLVQRCYDGSDWCIPNIDKISTVDLFDFLGLD